MAQLCTQVSPVFWDQALASLLEMEMKSVFNPNMGLFFDQFSVQGLGLLEKSQNELKQRLAKR